MKSATVTFFLLFKTSFSMKLHLYHLAQSERQAGGRDSKGDRWNCTASQKVKPGDQVYQLPACHLVAYEGKMKGTCSQTEADVRRTKMTDMKERRAESYQCIVCRLGAIDLMMMIIIIIILFFFSQDMYHVTHAFRTPACPSLVKSCTCNGMLTE